MSDQEAKQIEQQTANQQVQEESKETKLYLDEVTGE